MARIYELFSGNGDITRFINDNFRFKGFRHMPFVKGLKRITVYYSTYGAPYTKPTDFFSNFDIERFFDLTITKGSRHLDYCCGYNDFLGRCKIPDKLVLDISTCLLTLALYSK